jgi:hypothetical protein
MCFVNICRRRPTMTVVEIDKLEHANLAVSFAN